jgi:Fic family protein
MDVQHGPPHISPEVLSLVASIDEFKGRWQALKNLAPDRLTALRRAATVESIGSSTRIEGAKLSNHQVGQLLASLAKGPFKTRDEQEVAGYARVMEIIFEAWQTIPITENYIQQLHGELLAYSEKDARHRGHYKKHPNHVAAFDAAGKQIGIVFETTPPFNTPLEMERLLAWFQESRKPGPLHPLLTSAIFIVRFLAIHPFQDGNGRLSRILTTLLLLQAGYIYVPYSSLESIVEQNKESYYLALRQTQLTLKAPTPEWEPWIIFFLKSLLVQTEKLRSKIDAERAALASLSPLARTITDILATEPRVTVARVVALTGISRNTVKQTLSRLKKEGLLIQHGNGRGAFYAKP